MSERESPEILSRLFTHIRRAHSAASGVGLRSVRSMACRRSGAADHHLAPAKGTFSIAEAWVSNLAGSALSCLRRSDRRAKASGSGWACTGRTLACRVAVRRSEAPQHNGAAAPHPPWAPRRRTPRTSARRASRPHLCRGWRDPPRPSQLPSFDVGRRTGGLSTKIPA